MNNFIEVDLEQGSEAWLRWREGGITATQSSIIMGLNPYESIETLFRTKAGLEPVVPFENAAMTHGKNTEEEARAALIRVTGTNFIPKCVQHPEVDFLRASLDGIDTNGSVICEIKCPLFAGSFVKHNREVPEYYYCQMQHQLLTTGADMVLFWSYFDKQYALHEVTPNQEFLSELIRREQLFWNHIVNKEEPDYKLFFKYEYDKSS